MDSNVAQLSEEEFVRHFVECLTEVQYDRVCDASIIHCSVEISGCDEKLRFT